MPNRPFKACSYPGCHRLTTEGSRCEKHTVKPKPWIKRRQYPRLAGSVLQRERERLFRERPYCEACGLRPSTIRDHIVPVSEGGGEEPDNIQALCGVCNKIKSEAEKKRGKRRSENSLCR